MATITGTAGQDTYNVFGSTELTVTDFAAGTGGDRIDLTYLLYHLRSVSYDSLGGRGYDGGNPFIAGNAFIRLVQSGPDTLLQYDEDGAAGGAYGWHTAATLLNVDMTALTAENFMGVAPDGSPVAGQVITGTALADDLHGGFFDDTISGGDGDDHLHGGGGNDWIEGGAGNDFFDETGQVNDTVHGGDGNDTFRMGPDWTGYGSGAVLASGGAGQDTYYLLYNDLPHGLTITDFHAGDDGDRIGIEGLLPYVRHELWYFAQRKGDGSYEGGNPFSAELGYVRLVQEGAHTLLQFDPDGAAGITHDWHTTAVLQDVDASTLTADNFGGISPDGSPVAGRNLVGTDFADELQGWLSDDTLLGELGSDTLRGGAGSDTLEGGAGNDQLDGESGDDVVLGGDGDDVFMGSGTSNDTLHGGAGDDMFYLFLHGGAEPQAVRAIGGAGDDFFLTHVETDTGTILFTGGAGQDTYYLVPWSVTQAAPHGITVTDFATGAGGDLLEISSLLSNSARNGGFPGGNPLAPSSRYVRFVKSGTDTLLQFDEDGTAGTASGWQTVMRLKNVDPSEITADNFASTARTGTAEPEWMIGGLGRDTLAGAGGNDTVDGGFGADSMAGGVGDDTYGVTDTGDVVVELANEGIDTVRASVDWELGANFENLVLETGAIRGTGNAAANEITGNDAANVLDGGEGRDTLAGGAGDDEYRVDNLADRVIELAGAGIDLVVSSARTYTLGANVENATIEGDGAAILIGNARANVLQGGGGSNRLEGGASADSLVGGGGRDVLTGGTGGDLFVFEAASDTGVNALARDRISDFVAGIGGDRIDLSGIDAKAGTAANNAFTFIGNSAFHGTNASGQLRYEYDSVKGVGILYGSTDADSAAEFSIELTGVASLAAADLIL
jgi:Ca2+-binding RTX toxin-like protein